MIRVQWVVLLALVAVLVDADATLIENPKPPKLPLRSDPPNVYFNRILRVDGEERAGVSFSVIEKAKARLMPAVSDEKLAKWLTKGKSANSVFVRLGLTKAGDKLFETPQFFTWAKYVDDLGKKAPAKAPTMIPALTAQYGDDALYRMIVAAKTAENADVKKFASRLEVELLYAWATKGKSPDDALALITLSKAGDDLLSTPQFSTLTNYLKIFNSKNDEEKKTTMIATLVKSYGDEKVAKMLQAATRVPETAASAQKLNAELIHVWLAMELLP